MKDSTGGLLLMGLASAIILVFIVLVAFFINYGITFKAKNQIINKIEQSEGLTKSDIETFVANSTNYHNEVESCYNLIKKLGGKVVGYTTKVTLHIKFDKTILGSNILRDGIDIKIVGESKTINSGIIFENFEKGINTTGMNKCS